MAMRWKLNPRETGLAAVGAGPRGSTLRDGETVVACVYPNGGNWQRPLRGWYFVVGWDSGLPSYNSYSAELFYPTATEAKAAALAHVKAALAAQQDPTP